MPFFMLLLHHEAAGWPRLSPEEMHVALERYTSWRTKPFVVDSKRLTVDASRVIRTKDGQPLVTDGPYSETKEVLGGYFTIEAADWDEAVARALEHPHVDYGGTVEIRQVWVM